MSKGLEQPFLIVHSFSEELRWRCIGESVHVVSEYKYIKVLIDFNFSFKAVVKETKRCVTGLKSILQILASFEITSQQRNLRSTCI